MPGVRFDDVGKRFGSVEALRQFDLTIGDGEFMVLVGPSGSGKSTALRILAGLEALSDGHVYIGERCVDRTPPKSRDIAMVFQDYALYPQMSVRQNLAFGLRVRKIAKAEIDRRVEQAAEALGLAELLGRKPGQLSGGQRQRVALGRALVREPQVFLMDEPLSNLDAKLRVQTRSEIRRLQIQTSVTTVYVTHDQVEAMTMGDRVAVVNDGIIEQVGPPSELYSAPANVFVAGFIGSPPMGLAPFGAEQNGRGLRVRYSGGEFGLDVPGARPGELVIGSRPEHTHLWTGDRDLVGPLHGRVSFVESLGRETLVGIRCGDAQFTAVVEGQARVDLDEAVDFGFQRGWVYAFDPTTGVALGRG